MMLRMMMLRRRTDPKTGTRTLLEPVQSKCTWTFHEGHFVREFRRKRPRSSCGKKNASFRKSPSVWTRCFSLRKERLSVDTLLGNHHVAFRL